MLGEQILELLKQEIPQIEYDRYIKQLRYDEEASRSDIAIFYAPNPLIARWVKTRYGEKLSHLIEIKTGVKPQVTVEVKSTKKKSISSRGGESSEIGTANSSS